MEKVENIITTISRRLEEDKKVNRYIKEPLKVSRLSSIEDGQIVVKIKSKLKPEGLSAVEDKFYRELQQICSRQKIAVNPASNCYKAK